VHSEELAPYLGELAKSKELTNGDVPAKPSGESEVAEATQTPTETEVAEATQTPKESEVAEATQTPKETEVVEATQTPKETEAVDLLETGGAVQELEAPKVPETEIPTETEASTEPKAPQQPEKIEEATKIPGAFESAEEPKTTASTNGQEPPETKNGLEVLGLPKATQELGSSIGVFKEH
jgi:hypothetical protein